MKKILVILTLVATSVLAAEKNIADYLQSISVTVRSEAGFSRSEGSGVIYRRDVDGKQVSFIWTAGHVVRNLRKVREVIDPEKGSPRKLIEFGDAKIVREMRNANGRKVGEVAVDAKIIKYSDAEDGHDLALMMVRSRDMKAFGTETTKFKLDDKPVPLGTHLFHVGSLLGQMGSNSMTDGIMSQHGRIFKRTFMDQTTVVAFPGSSGGGVFLAKDGTWVGMIVRGAGEGFNLTVPARRLVGEFCEKHKIRWAVDPAIKVTMADINNMAVEDVGIPGPSKGAGDEKLFPILPRITDLSGNPINKK
tara:strand:+ start:3793 stop:4707 length:915 start_codon:yes stop_codon:yes gene_type:complete